MAKRPEGQEYWVNPSMNERHYDANNNHHIEPRQEVWVGPGGLKRPPHHNLTSTGRLLFVPAGSQHAPTVTGPVQLTSALELDEPDSNGGLELADEPNDGNGGKKRSGKKK